jgi:hypothetical protein
MHWRVKYCPKHTGRGRQHLSNRPGCWSAFKSRHHGAQNMQVNQPVEAAPDGNHWRGPAGNTTPHRPPPQADAPDSAAQRISALPQSAYHSADWCSRANAAGSIDNKIPGGRPGPRVKFNSRAAPGGIAGRRALWRRRKAVPDEPSSRQSTTSSGWPSDGGAGRLISPSMKSLGGPAFAVKYRQRPGSGWPAEAADGHLVRPAATKGRHRAWLRGWRGHHQCNTWESDVPAFAGGAGAGVVSHQPPALMPYLNEVRWWR